MGKIQNQASTQDNTNNQAIDSKQPATSNNPTQMQETTRRILLHKEFRLSGDPNHIFSVPLGWKLSCQARAFINDQIQPYPQPYPKKAALKPPTSTPTTADGNSFQMVPCEKTIQAVKREPVRTHLDKAPRNSSLSFKFWELIDQLNKDFKKPDAAGPGGCAAQGKPVAVKKD